jgi:hypothetical protein
MLLTVTITEEKYDAVTEDIHTTRVFVCRNDLPWIFRKVSPSMALYMYRHVIMHTLYVCIHRSGGLST